MTGIDNWLERYERGHEDLTNPVVYWAAVPMVVLGTVGLLVAGTVGLWLGRRGPGSLGAIVQDFQLLMIGPVWLLSVIYRRFGVPF